MQTIRPLPFLDLYMFRFLLVLVLPVKIGETVCASESLPVMSQGLPQSSGFAKTFCPSLVILSDEAGVLCQTFLVFISHFTLKMAGKYD